MSLADKILEHLEKARTALQSRPWTRKKKVFSEIKDDYRLDAITRKVGDVGYRGFIYYYHKGWDLNAFMADLGEPKKPVKFTIKHDVAFLIAKEDDLTRLLNERRSLIKPHYDVSISGKRVRIVHDERHKEIRFAYEEGDYESILEIEYFKQGYYLRLNLRGKGDNFHPHLKPALEFMFDEFYLWTPLESSSPELLTFLKGKDFPMYMEPVKNLFVIGVPVTKPKPHSLKLRDFRNAITSLDHLTVEYTRRALGVYIGLFGEDRWDIQGVNYFGRNLVFLDEKINTREFIKARGMSSDYYCLLGMISNMLNLKSPKALRQGYERIPQTLQNLRDMDPVWKEVDINRFEERFGDCWVQMLKDKKLFEGCAEVTYGLRRFLRDAKTNDVYVPALLNMRKKYRGRIGAIFDGNKANEVYNALRGKYKPFVGAWEEFAVQQNESFALGERYLKDFAMKNLE